MTTITHAIRKAKARVHLDRFGRQWIVNVYDPKMNAWWQGNPTEWDRAKAVYREDLICEALDVLEIDDPEYHANVLAERDGKWENLVRGFVRQQRAE